MPKSKFMTKLYGGNKESSEPNILPNISDDQIDSLYSELSQYDFKFESYPGSKREYVLLAYQLMGKFLDNITYGKASGSGKTKKQSYNEPIEDNELAKDLEDLYNELEARRQELIKQNPDIEFDEIEDDSEIKDIRRDITGLSIEFFERTGVNYELLSKSAGDRPAFKDEKTRIRNPFYTMDISPQDILDRARRFKDTCPPLLEALKDATKSPDRATANLAYVYKYPYIGNFAGGQGNYDIFDKAQEEREQYGKKVLGKTDYNRDITEFGSQMEVAWVQLNQKEFNNEEEQKQILASYVQHTINKFDSIDVLRVKDGKISAIELKASAKMNNPYTSAHKLVLQLGIKNFQPESENSHNFLITKKSSQEYLKDIKIYNNRKPEYILDMKLDTFVENTRNLPLYDKDNKIVPGKTLSDLFSMCQLDGDMMPSKLDKKKFNKLDDKQKEIYLNQILKLNNKGKDLSDSLTWSLVRARLVSQEDNGKRIRFMPNEKINNDIIKGTRIKDNKQISLKSAYSRN